MGGTRSLKICYYFIETVEIYLGGKNGLFASNNNFNHFKILLQIESAFSEEWVVLIFLLFEWINFIWFAAGHFIKQTLFPWIYSSLFSSSSSFVTFYSWFKDVIALLASAPLYVQLLSLCHANDPSQWSCHLTQRGKPENISLWALETFNICPALTARA